MIWVCHGNISTIMQWMLQNFCEFSPDYTSLLRKLKDPLNLRASERIIQFPYTLPVTEEKTEEELARIAERKKEQGRKLQELAAKSRMEKVSLGGVLPSTFHRILRS